VDDAESETTLYGRALQILAAATGNARLPMVDCLKGIKTSKSCVFTQSSSDCYTWTYFT